MILYLYSCILCTEGKTELLNALLILGTVTIAANILRKHPLACDV